MDSLRRSSIAHGDLQHGNIIVVNSEIRLVDYDGMYVPGLAGKLSPELGQRNYQHPRRTEKDYGPNMDNFSSWVIYISLIALAVQPELWRECKGGDDCLLLRKSDFETPNSSVFFRTLESGSDDRLRSAVTFFHSLLYLGSRDVPALDGQLVPSVVASPRPSTGGDWIKDYVGQPRQGVAKEPAALDPILPLRGFWILFPPPPRWLVNGRLRIQLSMSASP